MKKKAEPADKKPRAKNMKTRVVCVVSLPNESKDPSLAPYQSSSGIASTKKEFLKMANYWWDHRIPGQNEYDVFEAVAQPCKQ